MWTFKSLFILSQIVNKLDPRKKVNLMVIFKKLFNGLLKFEYKMALALRDDL